MRLNALPINDAAALALDSSANNHCHFSFYRLSPRFSATPFALPRLGTTSHKFKILRVH